MHARSGSESGQPDKRSDGTRIFRNVGHAISPLRNAKGHAPKGLTPSGDGRCSTRPQALAPLLQWLPAMRTFTGASPATRWTPSARETT